jgi:hypothetical protein
MRARAGGSVGLVAFAEKHSVIPGPVEGANPELMNTTLLQFVMLALVASIHVLNTILDQRRRGWSAQVFRPGT